MILKVRYYDIESSEPRVILHETDAAQIGVKEMDRVRLDSKKALIILVGMSKKLLKKGEIMIPENLSKRLGYKDGDEINVVYSPKPDSVRSIRKKMDNEKLSKDEIAEIVTDILDAKLSKIEISAWLTSLQIVGMDVEEIANFATAMVNTGDIIEFERQPVYDFHSIGGVPGNKITPIVVSIIAAAGMMLPKTSSRAISSACGTSDFVETFCEVELDAATVKSISETVGGVLAWGGSMNLAPVDDMVIKVEYPLGINPRPQMLASIMSKKLAMSSSHLLVDIPTGPGTKVKTIEEAQAYARDFMDLGSMLGMHVECAITYGDQPVGNAIGPKLEARECIRILEGHKHPSSVIEKACDLAGMILEMGGVQDGPKRARELLDSGEAHKKFLEIVVAQKGRADLKADDLEPGKFMYEVTSTKSGYVHSIANKDLVTIARAAGSPADKGAGILLMKKKGQRVEKGDVLFQIYGDNDAKALRAKDTAMKLQPIVIEGMLIKKVAITRPLK